MDLQIRKATVGDWPAILAIINRINNRPRTLEEFSHTEQSRDPSIPYVRMVAVEDGQVVAHASGGRVPWITDREMLCQIQVRPEHRSRGVGSALLAAMMPFYQEHRPENLRATAFDTDPSSLGWAERRGFQVISHTFESVADLREFEFGPYQGVVRRLEEDGLRLVPFPELTAEDRLERLFGLVCNLFRDLPDADDWAPPKYQVWKERFLDSPQAWPESCLVAVAPEGDWVGYTCMSKVLGKPGAAYLENTWVDERWRGRSVALALKTLGMARAREAGISEVFTNNHSGNQPILRLNERLGFQARPGVYFLRRELG